MEEEIEYLGEGESDYNDEVSGAEENISPEPSQDTIDLNPKMTAPSDFFMKDDQEKKARDDNLEKMFPKKQSVVSGGLGSQLPSIVSGVSVPTAVSGEKFVEGEETEISYRDEVFYEEDLEGEYEFEDEEWAQGEELHERVHFPEEIKIRPHRTKSKKKQSTGDFGMMVIDTSQLFTVTKVESFGSVDSEKEGSKGESVVEEEVKEAVEEEEEKLIDREPYYELYRSLLQEYPMVKMKNNFLQRKMAEYFKKRKMEHVLREAERVGDAEQKYLSKLDALWELKNTNDMQRKALSVELDEMKELRDKQYNSVMKNFEAMLAREKEIGTGLIFTKTAKEIPEKFLERLIKNQRLKSNEISDMRLKFIKLRNSIDEITTAIRAMDKIGENHTLIDYEQLKMENQNYSDKIEERDEELSKLREKCSGAIQTLAHLREKSAAMDIDILDMAESLEEAVLEKNEFREKVGQLKHERDHLRANIVKLQEESGLLTKDKLLLDMEDTLDQIASIKNDVARIENTYKENARALSIIKHNIKVEKELFQNRAFKVEEERKKPKEKKTFKRKLKFGEQMLEKFKIEL